MACSVLCATRRKEEAIKGKEEGMRGTVSKDAGTSYRSLDKRLLPIIIIPDDWMWPTLASATDRKSTLMFFAFRCYCERRWRWGGVFLMPRDVHPFTFVFSQLKQQLLLHVWCLTGETFVPSSIRTRITFDIQIESLWTKGHLFSILQGFGKGVKQKRHSIHTNKTWMEGRNKELIEQTWQKSDRLFFIRWFLRHPQVIEPLNHFDFQMFWHSSHAHVCLDGIQFSWDFVMWKFQESRCYDFIDFTIAGRKD